MKTKLLLLVLPLVSLAAQNGPGPRMAAGAPATNACPQTGSCLMGTATNAANGCIRQEGCPMSGAGNGSAGCARSDACPLTTATNAQPTALSAGELNAAIDEERMAGELYRAAAARWQLPVFSMIAMAEARHEAAFQRLAATSGVTVPAAQAGVFAGADTQKLHDQLAGLIAGSSAGALKAAALLEETNLIDLRQLRQHATDTATPLVLTQLERASSHHLAAFVRNLQAAGETYQPHLLTAEEYAAVIARPQGVMVGRGYRGGR